MIAIWKQIGRRNFRAWIKGAHEACEATNGAKSQSPVERLGGRGSLRPRESQRTVDMAGAVSLYERDKVLQPLARSLELNAQAATHGQIVSQ